MEVGSITFLREGGYTINRWSEDLIRKRKHVLPTEQVLEDLDHLSLIQLVWSEDVKVESDTIGPEGVKVGLSEKRTDGLANWSRYYIFKDGQNVQTIILDYREYIISYRDGKYRLIKEAVRY